MAALCLTPACIIAASNIIQNLAPNYQSIDPCDDFDQYVCGGFPTRFPDKKNLGVLEIAIARNHDLVHLLLDGDYPASSEVRCNLSSEQNSFAETKQASPDGKAIFAKLQNNYLACMDTASIQAEGDRGAKAIFDHVAELLPAPDLNATLSIHDYESMADLQVFLNTLGVDLFMGYRTSADTGFSVSLTAGEDYNLHTDISAGNTTNRCSPVSGFVHTTCRNECHPTYGIPGLVSSDCPTTLGRRTVRECIVAGRESVFSATGCC